MTTGRKQPSSRLFHLLNESLLYYKPQDVVPPQVPAKTGEASMK
jgi:hypothetical protein